MRKRKFRIGLLDVFLFLLSFVSILTTLSRVPALSAQRHTKASSEALVTLCIRGMDPAGSACLSEGEMLYFADGRAWGRVKKIKCVPARVELEHEGIHYTGTWESGERCDLYVTAELTGAWQGKTFLQDEKHAVLVAAPIELYGSRMRLCGFVSECIPKSGEN